MQLDWHELRTNGCPALLRALKQIEHALGEQSQLLSVAEKQDQLILAAQLQQGADITDLQCLISEEIMARIAPPEDLMVVVEDLDHGWLTVRQPNENPDAATFDPPTATMLTGFDWVSSSPIGTPGVSWMPDDWVTQYTADVEKGEI
jgi:hypothetical protein